ncbi:hypothetical protein C8Q74DRAFT_206342 [Fomes fomentarius]|nr:hypothetical protein C8Q74DRAFT_206342 [Fomes fomentarius]
MRYFRRVYDELEASSTRSVILSGGSRSECTSEISPELDDLRWKKWEKRSSAMINAVKWSTMTSSIVRPTPTTLYPDEQVAFYEKYTVARTIRPHAGTSHHDTGTI